MAEAVGDALTARRLRAGLAGLGLALAGTWEPLWAITSEEQAEHEMREHTGILDAEDTPTVEGSGPTAPIGDPGPDLANFPNSSYTLPEGGFYFESSPLSYYGSSMGAPPQWSLSYLLRYGLFENIELRLFSNGLTFRSDEVGTSPLAIDTKAHLWDYDSDGLNASVGIEAYVQPPNWLATSDFRQPLQFAATLLVDHNLPWDIAMGWNVGFTRTLGQEQSFTRPTIQWAFQRNVTEDIAVFIQGFHNAATLPGVPMSQALIVSNRQTDVVGFGGQWTLNERVAIFGNMNWGLTPLSPKEIANLGFAVAF